MQGDGRREFMRTARREPEDIHRLFESFINSGNLEGLVDLYEPGAVLALSDGVLLCGHEAIRKHFTSLILIHPRMNISVRETVLAGEIAVLISEWSLSALASDGTHIDEHGCTYDILHRQEDGTWRIAVDNPWGCPDHPGPSNLSQ